MNKYVSPTIKIEDIDVSDVVLASGYEIKALDGVDSGDSKSAVFNVNRWIY